MKKLLFCLLLLIFFSCEKEDIGENCCWVCKTQIIEYNPRAGVEKIITTITFADSIFCNCPTERIKRWEEINSYTDTVNGKRIDVISKCKQ